MARKQPPKKEVTTPLDLKANDANSINPLDDLPYDINTLIPFNEFNWDAIAGMDDIHNDVMKSYGSLASQLVGEVAKIEERVGIIDANIVNSLERQSQMIDNNVTAIDTAVFNTLDDATSCLRDEYGNCIGELNWYLVTRESSQYGLVWYAEQSTSAPIGREAYGPFKDVGVLLYPNAHWSAILPNRVSSDCQVDPLTQQQWNSLYEANLTLMKREMGTTWVEGSNLLYPSKELGISPILVGVGGNIVPCGLIEVDPVSNNNQEEIPNGCYRASLNLCPIGVECTTVSADHLGNYYYYVANDYKAYPYPGCPVNSESTLPNTVPADPFIPLPTTQTNPQQSPIVPITSNPSNEQPVYTPPISVQPTGVSCPAPIINNVINPPIIPPCPETDFKELITVLRDCCEALKTNAAEVKAESSGSDYQYLFADDSVKRMDNFFIKNDLMEYSEGFPKDLSKAIKTSLQRIDNTGGLDD